MNTNANDLYIGEVLDNKDSNQGKTDNPLGLMGKLKYGILFLVPIIGCYAICHYAFASENTSLKRYASVFFAVFWIIIAISLVLGIALFLYFFV